MYKNANLMELKLVGIAVEVAIVTVEELLDRFNNRHSTNITKVSFEKRYLTKAKETMIIYVANLMVDMDIGINKDTYLEIFFVVMPCRIASNDIDKSTIRILNDILNKNKSLLKLINDNVIDLVRV